MELQSSINEENLKLLMTSFYKKALLDEELGHFFIHELGEDITSEEWVEHIELLVDFWMSKLLNQGDYEGNFVGMHVHIPYIKREDFTKWLELFSQTVDTIYTPKVAEPFKAVGVRLSEKFIRELDL